MPRVTLKYSNNTTQTAQGGCFGFTGRYGMDSSSYTIPRGQTVEEFIFHAGESYQLQAEAMRAAADRCDPTAFYTWLLTESMWAKYVIGTTGEMTSRNFKVRIRTDVEGNAVIGTASAFRLAAKRECRFLSLWNRMVDAGVSGGVAFVVAYPLNTQVGLDYQGKTRIPASQYPTLSVSVNDPLREANPSAIMHLGDDEVCTFRNTHPDLVHSLVAGSLRYLEEHNEAGGGTQSTYANGNGYNQTILASFNYEAGRNQTPGTLIANCGTQFNFAKYLVARFNPALPVPSLIPSVSTGMGASRVGARTRLLTQAPILSQSVVGWALQLDAEYRMFGKFLGMGGTPSVQ
jgi:hypothetical protein